MAIELDTSRIATNTPTVATQGDAPATQEKKSTPVLGGASLTVSSGAMSDLEVLVARLKNETDNTKMSVAQTRISVLNTVLDTMKDRVTQAERASLVEIEELNNEKAEAENNLSVLEADKAAAKGRIAELDVMIETLERQIEQAVQDGEDHRKQVEKLKEQRAQEQKKLDQVCKAITSISARISDIDTKIAECSATIAESTLSAVTKELSNAANIEAASSGVERPESEADREKAAKKAEANNIGNVIRESLDKITEQIYKRLDEAQMKVEG